MSLQPGDQLGPYEILSLVGTGGMGEVYKALDSRLDRTVHLLESREVRGLEQPPCSGVHSSFAA